jgi:ABC-2 type transport system permease protein
MIQREMNLDIADNAAKVTGAYLRGRDLWEKLPDFQYSAPDVAWVVARQRLPFFLLFLWAIAAAAIAWRAAHRLEVE